VLTGFGLDEEMLPKGLIKEKSHQTSHEINVNASLHEKAALSKILTCFEHL